MRMFNDRNSNGKDTQYSVHVSNNQ